MSHTAQITEAQRTLLILMIDQSGSMSESYGPGSYQSKAEVVAQVCNRTLTELLLRCRDNDRWLYYFDIGVIGYSGYGIYPLLPGGVWTMSPAQLAASTIGNHKTEQYKTLKNINLGVRDYGSYKIWITPDAYGQTPMYAAFDQLHSMLVQWCNRQITMDIFPPTVINITDGEPTDTQKDALCSLVEKIRQSGTNDGEPIIFNAHISSNSKESFSFPINQNELPADAQLLYNISSVLPQSYCDRIENALFLDRAAAIRAMVYNANADQLVRLMSIGSSTITNQQ